jgi:hypothetical protein
MAGGGAKKRAEENRAKVTALGVFIVACGALHGVVRLWLRGSSTTSSSYLAFGATLAIQAVGFLGIAAVARPQHGAGGALVHGGGDLSKGLISYYFDIVYVTGFVQALAAFFSWGWYAYLVVPAYGCYMLGLHVVKPWLASGWVEDAPGDGVDAATRKKWEKQEQRQDRRRVRRI